MELKKFKTGEFIIKQGDVRSDAYSIVKGCVQIFHVQGKERITLGMLGAGEIFGEMGMIDDKPRSASVQAIESTEVEVVTPKDFNETILRNPDQLVPYLRSFFERLRRTNENFSALVLPFATEAPDVEESADIAVSKELEPGAIRLVAGTEHLRQRVMKPDLTVRKFPFRIGRWSENFQADVFVSNDLLVRDEEPYQISRNHCAIEREGKQFYVLDRGSAFGTQVNGKEIGGVENQMIHPLRHGANEVRLGGKESPYQFQIVV